MRDEVITTLATLFCADQRLRGAIKDRWSGTPEELCAVEEWAKAHRDPVRAAAHAQRVMSEVESGLVAAAEWVRECLTYGVHSIDEAHAQLFAALDEHEEDHLSGVIEGLQIAKRIAIANADAMIADGHQRRPEHLASQIEHEIARLRGEGSGDAARD